MLGLHRPASGRIAIFGHPTRQGDPTIGYLPQSHSASPDINLCGWEILASSLHGHRYGLPLPSARGRADITWALKAVDGEALAERPLSAGRGSCSSTNR